MKEKTLSRPLSSPSPNPCPNSRSHRIMQGPISRVGERPFVPQHAQQSHDPDNPSLWPEWWGLCIIPRNSLICAPMQAALPLCPGVQPPGTPWPPSPMGQDPRRGGCHGPLHGEPGRTPFSSPTCPILLPTAWCFGVSVLVSQPCCTQGSLGIPASPGGAGGCV